MTQNKHIKVEDNDEDEDNESVLPSEGESRELSFFNCYIAFETVAHECCHYYDGHTLNVLILSSSAAV